MIIGNISENDTCKLTYGLCARAGLRCIAKAPGLGGLSGHTIFYNFKEASSYFCTISFLNKICYLQ
jgi:hypothetical protein